MITATLDELTQPALKARATSHGVSFASNITKAQLMALLQPYYPSQAGPGNPPTPTPATASSATPAPVPNSGIRNRLFRWANAAQVALLVNAGVLLFTGYAAITTSRDIAKRDHDAKVLTWQQLVVYRIIDNPSDESAKEHGLDFDTIQTKYQMEHASVKEVDLSKEDLQPLVLQKILLQLQVSNEIFKTQPDGKYKSNRGTYSRRFGRQALEDEAKYDMIGLLMTFPGNFNVNQIRTDMVKDHRITDLEFNLLLNQLIAGGMVSIDSNGRLWCVGNPMQVRPVELPPPPQVKSGEPPPKTPK